MIAEGGAHVVSIDAKVVPIDSEKSSEFYEHYIQRVEDLLEVKQTIGKPNFIQGSFTKPRKSDGTISGS